MKIKTYEERVKYMQEGGSAPVAPAEEGAPAAGGEDQMMQQLTQMAQEIISQLGPEAAAMLAQVIMEMLQGAQQGAEAGAEQQFMRRGGKICKGSRVAKKGCALRKKC